MALYQRSRKGFWSVDIATPKGERIRRSTKTKDKQLAQQIHDKWKLECWQQSFLDKKPDYLWQDAVIQWCKDMKHKTSLTKDLEICRWLSPYLDGIKLADITRELLCQIADKKAEMSSEATADRHLALVRSILNKAVNEWGWLDKAPKVRMFNVINKRIRWLTRSEFERLLFFAPEHTKPIIQFSVLTGLRHNNVTQLKWSQLDLAKKVAWIHPDESKNKKTLSVPLNKEAVRVVRAQLGKHDTFVFTYNNKPILTANTKAFRKAVKRAGLKDFRWHDLRHTWATWHIQSGTSMDVLQTLGGWQSIEMVKRYAHFSAEQLAVDAERITIYDTFTSQMKSASWGN